jgi:hypothetical protein
MLGLQRNPVGTIGIVATAVMAGAGVLGFAKGTHVRRKRLGLEPDQVVIPRPKPAPAKPTTPDPVPPSDDTLVTYVDPTPEALAACGGAAECWLDQNGVRYCRCLGNTEPASGDATKCPAGYFYDAKNKVCCPDGFYYDTKDRTCRPMGG